MRCDQYMGLNSWATGFLLDHQTEAEVVTFAYSPSKEWSPRILSSELKMIPTYKVEVIGKIEGAWDEHVADLHKYLMPDGSEFEEFVQATPWSSGPCYFIALRSSQGTICQDSLWTDQELEKELWLKLRVSP
jgi:hypothetical protein